MSDLISVIIPIYKVEKYLDKCLQSVTNQTYKNLEIILVDDGSPDDCPRICDGWAKLDKRIKVIHKENGGLSSARNAGLDAANGNYISFIDSDDYVDLNMYSIMLNDIKQKDVDVVKCAKFFDVSGTISNDNILDSPKIYSKEEILDKYFYYKEDFCGGCWDKLYKAKFFENIRFPQGINSEDYYMYVQLYSKIDKLYFNNIPLYYYRIREDSICRKKEIDEHCYDKIKISDMVYKYTENNLSKYKRKAKNFQALSRFAVFNRIVKDYGINSYDKKWKFELRKYIWTVLVERNGVMQKLKYIVFSIFPRLYLKIKGL